MSNPSTTIIAGKGGSVRKSEHQKGNSTVQKLTDDENPTGVYGAGNVTHLTHKIFKLGEEGSGTRPMEVVQDFDRLKKKYLAKGKLFKDRNFPARDSSIFPTHMPEKYKGKLKWKRPGEIVENPKFFVEGPSAFDVRQGKLGDCWLLASVADLAQHPNLLSRVVPQARNYKKNYDGAMHPSSSSLDESDCECRTFDKEKYAGIFHFRFWHFGSWVDVVIDDRLPTYNRKLIFSKSSQKNEFWCALLEKAYAKLHGSYEILRGGKSSKALEDLTGGICVSHRLDDKRSNLMEALIQAQGKNALAAFTSLRRKNSAGSFNTTASCNGIVQGHTYSMTKFLGEHREQLLRLRNPWGKGAWTGKWSNSWLSEHISEDEGQQLESDTHIHGEFFISFESVKFYFKYGNICYFNPVPSTGNDTCSDLKEWEMSAFEGEWIPEKTAGGRYIARDTRKFWSNPQYRLTLERPPETADKCEVIVGLTQNTLRSCHADNLGIGLYIFSLKNPKSPRKVHSRRPKKYHTIGSYLRLPPGTYCIVPTTRVPNQCGKFLLRVFSKWPIIMEEDILPVDGNNENDHISKCKQLEPEERTDTKLSEVE